MHLSASAVEIGPWNDCLAIARQLLATNMDFCMTVRVGSLSFSLDARKARNILLSTDSPGGQENAKVTKHKGKKQAEIGEVFGKEKGLNRPGFLIS